MDLSLVQLLRENAASIIAVGEEMIASAICSLQDLVNKMQYNMWCKLVIGIR